MTAWLEKPTTISDRATALMETIQQEKKTEMDCFETVHK